MLYSYLRCTLRIFNIKLTNRQLFNIVLRFNSSLIVEPAFWVIFSWMVDPNTVLSRMLLGILSYHLFPEVTHKHALNQACMHDNKNGRVCQVYAGNGRHDHTSLVACDRAWYRSSLRYLSSFHQSYQSYWMEAAWVFIMEVYSCRPVLGRSPLVLEAFLTREVPECAENEPRSICWLERKSRLGRRHLCG